MEKITVITPHYNRDILYRTIDSVLEQDYPDIEYIIVCDGSKICTATEVREYLKTNAGTNVDCKVIDNPRNMGLVKSLNIAVKEATGKYIYNLADDDVFFDNCVLTDWTEFFEKTGAMVSMGRTVMCDSKSGENLYETPKEKDKRAMETLTPKQLFEYMAGENFILGSCTARRKECFEKYGLFDEQYKIIEDYPMNMKLLRNNVKISFFDRMVIRCLDDGISKSKNANKEYFKVSEMIFKNEIYPYATSKIAASLKYYTWAVKHYLVRYIK